MAAVTITSGPRWNAVGNRRHVQITATAPADGDTWNTGLQSIDNVLISFPAGNLAAADSVSYTASGGTVTIKVVGTARDLNIQAIGV
jgi:hypothetical protein